MIFEDPHEDGIEGHVAFAASKGMQITLLAHSQVELVTALSDVPPLPAQMGAFLAAHRGRARS